MEDAAPAGGAKHDECTWGLRPHGIHGIGLSQTERKYLASLRKYILLYTKLLVQCGDLDTLEVRLVVLLYRLNLLLHCVLCFKNVGFLVSNFLGIGMWTRSNSRNV
jgi:hypothetical protein